jgi:hypothetical protein
MIGTHQPMAGLNVRRGDALDEPGSLPAAG